MVRFGAAIAFGAMAACGSAQSQADVIWAAAYNKMSRQNEAWFEKGDFPRTIQSLRFMNRLWPADYEVATNLGWLLFSTERRDEELSVYVRFRNENPKDPDAALPEATMYFTLRTYAKVPPLLEPSLKLQPHPNAYRILAHSYEKLNMLADSKRVWELYLKRAPNDPAAKNNLNRVVKKIEDAKKKP